MKEFYDQNGYFSPLKIYNAKEANFFRNKLEENINYRGILTHYSKTIENSDDWIKKTSKTPPYENSNGGPLYHKSFT